MHWRSMGTLVAMTLVASACGGHMAGTAPSNAPRFATVILSDVPQDATEKTVFTPYASVFAHFTLADVAKGTTIKATWIREPSEKMDEDFLVTTTGNDKGYFGLRRPVGCAPPPGPCGSPLPTGAYRVDLFIARRLAMVKHFRVEAAAGVPAAWPSRRQCCPRRPPPFNTPQPPPGPSPAPAQSPAPEAQAASPGPYPNVSSDRIGPIVFARGVSSDGKPIERAQQFPLGVMQIYAIFDVRDLKANDTIGVVLYWGLDRPVDKKIPAKDLVGGLKDGPHQLMLTKSAPWSAGSYRLELSLNGTVVQKGTFEVVPKAGLGPIVFACDVDAYGTPFGAATQFSAGINKICAVFHGEGLKTGDAIEAIWYRGTEKVADHQFTGADLIGPPWIIIEQTFSPGWTSGSYRLELRLNGAVVQTGTFDVK